MGQKIKNKTIILSNEEIEKYHDMCLKGTLIDHDNPDSIALVNKIICGDTFKLLPYIGDNFFDLIIIDPPYNLSKSFGEVSFKKMGFNDYIEYLNSFLKDCVRVLKPHGTLYLCGDWKSTAAMQIALSMQNLTIQNRITWKRDKGRGASKNYKNNLEDIWFATKHPTEYTFNAKDIKIKKKVIAPYRNADGEKHDWEENNGKKWRLTCPSNLIDDVTVPYWSMCENTEHPTQKPEKLFAKLILASSNEGDLVFDPFCGSGTTAVVASKLNRLYCGIEKDREYCSITQYRLEKAQTDKRIQGYDEVEKCFLDRNYNDPRA